MPVLVVVSAHVHPDMGPGNFREDWCGTEHWWTAENFWNGTKWHWNGTKWHWNPPPQPKDFNTWPQKEQFGWWFTIEQKPLVFNKFRGLKHFVEEVGDSHVVHILLAQCRCRAFAKQLENKIRKTPNTSGNVNVHYLWGTRHPSVRRWERPKDSARGAWGMNTIHLDLMEWTLQTFGKTAEQRLENNREYAEHFPSSTWVAMRVYILATLEAMWAPMCAYFFAAYPNKPK